MENVDSDKLDWVFYKNYFEVVHDYFINKFASFTKQWVSRGFGPQIICLVTVDSANHSIGESIRYVQKCAQSPQTMLTNVKRVYLHHGAKLATNTIQDLRKHFAFHKAFVPRG